MPATTCEMVLTVQSRRVLGIEFESIRANGTTRLDDHQCTQVGVPIGIEAEFDAVEALQVRDAATKALRERWPN